MAMRIGVDLGGTKIEACLMAENGDIKAKERVTTPSNYVDLLSAIEQLVNGLESRVDEKLAIGIATPGTVSNLTGRIKNAPTNAINGEFFVEDIEQLLGRKVVVANDANCFALSESIDGAACEGNVVFGVILGTGTGGGIVVNKKLLTGPNGLAGEWGHNALPWPNEGEFPGPLCDCGKLGCLESWLSGPSMSRDHQRFAGEWLTAEKIVTMARAQEPQSMATLERYCERLAKSLATIINVLDPDIIVLGGGLSNITELYQRVPKRWGNYVFSDQVTTRLVPPNFGDSSGVRGAAWLCEAI